MISNTILLVQSGTDLAPHFRGRLEDRGYTVVEAVNVPFAVQFLDDDREVRANEAMILGAEGMLRELARLAALLRQLPTAV